MDLIIKDVKLTRLGTFGQRTRSLAPLMIMTESFLSFSC